MSGVRITIPKKIMVWLRENYGHLLTEEMRSDSNVVTLALAKFKSNQTLKIIKIKYDKKNRCINLIEK